MSDGHPDAKVLGVCLPHPDASGSFCSRRRPDTLSDVSDGHPDAKVRGVWYPESIFAVICLMDKIRVDKIFWAHL